MCTEFRVAEDYKNKSPVRALTDLEKLILIILLKNCCLFVYRLVSVWLTMLCIFFAVWHLVFKKKWGKKMRSASSSHKI